MSKIENPKHFWEKKFEVLYNKFSKQVKEPILIIISFSFEIIIILPIE